MDLTLEGKAYINGAFEQCCIGIDNGKIKEIKKILKGDEHLNFANKLILPAGVDVHVHFRDPGLTHKEDFYSGSLAAAFGGISCVFDMPNTIPQTTTIQNLNDKILSSGKKSVVDFGIYAGVTNDNLKMIEKLGKKCNAFKIYLGNTTVALMFNKKNLREALDLISITHKPVLLHAEDEECLIQNKSQEQALSDHLHSRPSGCEEISIKDVLEASKGINSKIHICHLSSCEGMELLKNRSRNISCGVTPHHSLLSVERDLTTQAFYKVNPPIRTSFDKEILFNALKNGMVDVLESDHAPHTRDEKNVDFDEAPSGVPSVETMYPLFLYLVKKEALSFQRLISLMCTRPADLMEIPKGRIEVGRDADFIIVDLKNESRIESNKLHSKCGWTPFEDWPAIFPESVFIRGERVIDNQEIQVSKGFGRFVGA
jgi:dihydroorotase